MKFKVGDKVKHRLGGDEMIVIRVNPKDTLPIGCRRYVIGRNGKEEYKTEFFKEEELEPVEEK